MVKKLAPVMGIPEEQLQVHNDQYTPDSFDFIITSIGNAFYETDAEGKFVKILKIAVLFQITLK